MKFLSREKISNHRYKTPEGYLVCLDAIIARTGKQDYAKNELFKDSDDESIISIDRPYKEVFSPETIASFENKPFVNEHPNEDVNIDNYRDYAIGFVRDVRKATIGDEDVLIANLVVTDSEAVAEIENGTKNELSCGYDCDILGDDNNYYQANIRGNHVALCKAGRAGIARIVDSTDVEDGKWYIVYGEESGYMKEFKTLNEAKKFIKEIQKFDKIEGIEDTYYIETEIHDSIEGEKRRDKNLGQFFLKVGQKVHLDPSKNKNLSKEDLNSEYEIIGFWYDGKLVTKDPVSKQEFLDMSGVRIKNTATGQKLSVNRFQLMDSIEEQYIKDSMEDMAFNKKGEVIPEHQNYYNDWTEKELEKRLIKADKEGEQNILKGLLNTLEADIKTDLKNSKLNKDLTISHYKKYINMLNGLKLTYYQQDVNDCVMRIKRLGIKDSCQDKVDNKPIKVRIKFDSNKEANDALKVLQRKEKFLNSDLIFDDTIEVKTTDLYYDDLKKLLKLYFVKKITVVDSIKEEDNMKKELIDGKFLDSDKASKLIKVYRIVKDSDKLKELAYKFAQMGNYFDRANSANSRNILAREDETKINEFYKLGLQVYDQLKKEVEFLRKNGEEKSNWRVDNPTINLLKDGADRLYWTRDRKCMLLNKKLNPLISEYSEYTR